MNTKTLLTLVCGIVLGVSSLANGQIKPAVLRSEYRKDPLGIDVVRPRLSWVLQSEQRGQKQNAYQVLVASTPEKLAAGQGDLWDSGKVESDRQLHVPYAGKPLSSRERYHWKVRVWDKDGAASDWSEPAMWSMGLLSKSDWGQARWIFDSEQRESPVVAGLRYGYQCQPAKSPDVEIQIVLDLGKLHRIDEVQLHPARPPVSFYLATSWLFPKRFRIEAATQSDFSDARTVVDKTDEDVPFPGLEAPAYRFEPTAARYVRLTVTRLRTHAARIHGTSLAELRVFSGRNNVAKGAKVSASDSLKKAGWSPEYLVDGRLISHNPYPFNPAAMMRKGFAVDGAIKRATVYVTALGLYELRINGRRVGDHLLAPEWTSYEKRVQYQTYDVTDLISKGENAIGAYAGEGWYTGRILTRPRILNEKPKLLLRLDVELANGKSQTIITDGSWRGTTDGPIRFSGIYDGETYDARREMAGWDGLGFDDSKWRSVSESTLDERKLVWQPGEPIRTFRELKPVKVFETRPGVYVFDMGQNMVGWCRLRVKGPAGTTVTLRHAERLNADNTLFHNLKGAASKIEYTLRGDSEGEVFEPHFTYQGFRYVQAEGLPSAPSLSTITGRIFHSASPDAGKFETSSAFMNKLMANIVWSQRGNMMGVITDCPQRDERLGWMGDAQLFAATMAYNMDVAAFFTKWIRDIRDAQTPDGRYPVMAPHVGAPNRFYAAPAWADAGVICPWRIYQYYADTRLIEEHYESAKRWVEWVRGQSPDYLWKAGGPGDWLNGAKVFFDGYSRKRAVVPAPIFATAFYAHSTQLLSKMAAAIGRDEDAREYAELFEQIKKAFNSAFVKPDGRISGYTQGGYALALRFDLLSDEMRPKAAQRMLDAFKPHNGHLSTGIQATHRLMLELTRNGYNDEAYRLLNLRTPPSWRYMIDVGATTIWERWDGWVQGRDVHPGGMGWMNSFNHVAFGAVGEWMWRNIIGINPDDSQPGFKHFVIRPRPGGGLNWAKGQYDSIRGKIISDWEIEGGKFSLNVTVPANTTATVYVPAGSAERVTESDRPAAESQGVRFLQIQDGCTVFEVGSGTYSFSTIMKGLP